jgi:thymidylate synthase
MTQIINYKPYKDRTPDGQYRKLLWRVMEEGKKMTPIHARLPENKHLEHKEAIDITGHILEYNLSNGFPLDTTRDLRKSFPGALGEICAFLNGVHTLEGFRKFGVPEFVWGPTLTEEKCKIFHLEKGDLGPGSYGSVLTEMPTGNTFHQTFNQILALENNIKKAPYARTHVLTTWYPPTSMGDKEQNSPRRVVVAPCHGNFTRFKIYDETKELHMVTVPRSSDAPVGLVYNIAQWCAVGMMLAHLFGYKFTKYVMMIMDPQIYDIQYEHVNKLLMREPRRLPTVRLEPKGERKHLWDYRPEDFILEDYDPYPGMKIPATV